MHNQANMQWLKKRQLKSVPKKYTYYPHEMKRNNEIKNVFQNIDKNSYGNLDMNNIYNMFQKYGFNIEKEKIQQLYDAVDEDKDNALNWIEFKNCAFNENANKIFSTIMRELRQEQEKSIKEQQDKIQEQKQYNKRNPQLAVKVDEIKRENINDYLPMNFGNMISFLSYCQTREEISTEIGNIGTKDQKLTDLETFQKLQELFIKSEEYQQNQQSMSTNPIALQIAEKKMEVSDVGSFKKYKKNFQENEFKSFFEKLEKQDKQNKNKYIQNLRQTQSTFAMNSSKNSNRSNNIMHQQLLQQQHEQQQQMQNSNNNRAQTSGIPAVDSQFKVTHNQQLNKQPKTSTNKNRKSQEFFKSQRDSQQIGSANYTPNWTGFSKKYFSGTLSDFGGQTQYSNKFQTKSTNFNENQQQQFGKRYPKNIRDMENYMNLKNQQEKQDKYLDKILTDNQQDIKQNEQIGQLRQEVQNYIQKAEQQKMQHSDLLNQNIVHTKEYQNQIIQDLKQQLIPQSQTYYSGWNQGDTSRYQKNDKTFYNSQMASTMRQKTQSGNYTVQMDSNYRNLKMKTKPAVQVRNTNKIPLELMRSLQSLKKIDERNVYQSMGHTFYTNNIFREMKNTDLKQKIRKISINQREKSLENEQNLQNQKQSKNLVAYNNLEENENQEQEQDKQNNSVENLNKSETANEYYEQNKVSLKTQDCIKSDNFQNETERQNKYEQQLIQDLNKAEGIMEKQKEPDILPESLKGSPRNNKKNNNWQFSPDNNKNKRYKKNNNGENNKITYQTMQNFRKKYDNQDENRIKNQELCIGHNPDAIPKINKNKGQLKLTKQQGLFSSKYKFN